MQFSIALRRLIRHSLFRRRRFLLRHSLGSLLLPLLALLTLLLLIRPPLVSNSEPLYFALRSAVRTAQSANLRSSHSQQALFEPLKNRVNAIVGAGHGARRGLEQVYGLPSVVVANMTQVVASRLYWKLVYADVVRTLRHSHGSIEHHLTSDAFNPAARVFFVHTQNGLGNRLRAMASGIAIARATGRIPVVVWERDPHLGAPFDTLFQTSAHGSDMATVLYKDIIVMDSFPEWHQIPTRTTKWRPISYMAKDVTDGHHEPFKFQLHLPDKPVLDPSYSMPATKILDQSKKLSSSPADPIIKYVNAIDDSEHIYFKSAYVAVTVPKVLSEPSYVNFELMNLKPSKDVEAIFSTIDPTPLTNAIGVHIRSRTLSNDNVAVNTNCEYTTEGARRTNLWRSRSQLPVFVERMKEAVRNEKGGDLKFFVAADDVKVLQELRAAFPNRIVSIPRACDDRELSCVKYALADLLGLSRTRLIFGSNWSSFTEAASRLGNKKVYLSGIDFGKKHGFSIVEGTRDALFTARRFVLKGVRIVFPWALRDPKGEFSNCIQR